MNKKLIEIENLKTYFYTEAGTAKAVDGISFDIFHGEVLGIVGESGSGKSVTSLSINRLIPNPPGDIVDGKVMFKGINLLDLSYDEMKDYRGKEIAMIFQEPMTSFSPVYTIGNQISEAIRLHQTTDKQEARQKTLEVLAMVGMPKPTEIINSYPFSISGGMRQRAMIAMALSCQPNLLIADEPTTAVDVTIQAQVLELIASLQEESHMALILITHDLGIIAEMAERVMVMYLGKNIESAPVEDLYYQPKHPYTQGLLASIPKFGTASDETLTPIEGSVPSLYEIPPGCSFHPRCPHFMPGKCDEGEPPETVLGSDHKVKCFLYGNSG